MSFTFITFKLKTELFVSTLNLKSKFSQRKKH